MSSGHPLDEFISSGLDAASGEPAAALTTTLRDRVPAARALLFYGAASRASPAQGSAGTDLFDFYVLLDRYRDAIRSPLLRAAASLLPPSLHGLELSWQGRVLRAKYALMRLDQFEAATRSFTPYIWGRFCQPVRLVFARDADARARVIAAQRSSLASFVSAALPLMPRCFSARELWLAGLRMTYRAELRPESPDRAESIYLSNAEWYDSVTRLILRDHPTVRARSEGFEWPAREKPADRVWAVRSAAGRGLSVLRLAHATTTFDGAVEYAVAKIERHTGRRPSVHDWERRHPVLAAPFLVHRLSRLGLIGGARAVRGPAPTRGGLLPLPAPRGLRERAVRLSNRLGGRVLRRLDRCFLEHSEVGQDAFFDPHRFPWVRALEAHWADIRRELDAVLDRHDELPAFQEISSHQRILTSDDGWKTFFFWGYGRRFGRNLERCPETARLLAQIPGMTTAMFSILAPGKHIPAHEGPYRGVLRYHLGVLVPVPRERCAIRVGGELRHWCEGKSLVFDDVFEHEVWNDTEGTRVVLFVDFKRPLRGPARLLNALVLGLIRFSPFVRDAEARHRAWEARFERARTAASAPPGQEVPA
jgi:beta-hydroxylase